jgi:AcrR family transcriptional regulator
VTATRRSRATGRSQAARARLLEAGGEVFSERGFEAATGKEIAERAGVNPAAVNYHFGSLEGLYADALAEARDRLVASEAFAEIMAAPGPPEAKLRGLIRVVVQAAVVAGRGGWGLKLLGREITTPSAVGTRLLISAVGPRARLFRSVVGQLAELPEDHPSVALGCISIIAPLQLLLIADRQVIRGVHPSVDISPVNEDALVEHFFAFAMAGLKALGSRAQ